MSGADLLEDSVPHGTTAGYAAGCRSLGACPGKETPYAQSCLDARRRQVGEYQYARAVAKGREVEFLQREAEERTSASAPSASVVKARRAQEKQQGVPLTPEPAPAAAAVPVAAELSVGGFTAERRANMARGVTEAQERQRAYALATASEEHPLGLALNGEPRKKAAAGTTLFRGRLMTREEAAAAIAAEVPRRGLTGADLLSRVAAPAVPEAAAAAAPAAGDAVEQVERLVRVLTGVDWSVLAATLRRVADAIEGTKEATS